MLSPANFENRTLVTGGTNLAASRLAHHDQITLTSPATTKAA
jgi:hypothetical protein